jgi:hypothetical protein
MPRLIKNIVGEVIEENVSSIDAFKNIEGQVGLEDYAAVYNFTGYLQNFSKLDSLVELETLSYYGLLTNRNKTFIEIEISY